MDCTSKSSVNFNLGFTKFHRYSAQIHGEITGHGSNGNLHDPLNLLQMKDSELKILVGSYYDLGGPRDHRVIHQYEEPEVKQ